MPRFDRGVVNTKLEKGDIVLMGNPTQYGEILAENILVEDILKADLETLISGSNLVRGKFYRITNAVSSTLSLLVQGLTANTICDYAYNTANGDLVTYNISTDLAGVPFSSVYVPYTGATTNVDLGEYQIKVGQLELDQTPTGTFGVGKIRWNDTDGTPEVMLKGANVTLQIGQEQLARVVNKTNTNLTEAGYQVVRISGAQGQRLKVGLAQANSTSTCKDTLGLVTENISNNAEGFITTSGLVRSINTTGSLQGETWADGDRIYLSPSVAGGITNVEPSAPNIVIVLGYVVYAHANQGSIYVSVEGAKALHELFDVSIPTPTNNNVLVYESSTGLWKDKSLGTILGGSSSQFVKGDGSLLNAGTANQFLTINNDGNSQEYKTLDYAEPEWFGASGDGSQDDTQAIRDCITFMNTYSVKNLHLKGTYLVSSPITLGQNKRVYGGGTLKRINEVKTTITQNLIVGNLSATVTSTTGFAIGQDIRIYKAGYGDTNYNTNRMVITDIQGNTIFWSGALTQSFSSGDFLITACKLLSVSDGNVIDGIDFDGNRTNNTSFTRWDVHNEIYGTSNTAEYTIQNCKIYNSVGDSVILFGNKVSVLNCRFENINGNAIHFSDTDQCIVDGCYIENTNLATSSVIGHAGGCISFSDVNKNIIISDCFLINGIYGIGFTSGSALSVNHYNAIIKGNTIRNCRTGGMDLRSTTAGVRFDDMTITGNKMYNSGIVDITSTASSLIKRKLIFKDNTIFNGRISVNYVEDCEISDNKIFNDVNSPESSLVSNDITNTCILISSNGSKKIIIDRNIVYAGRYGIYTAGATDTNGQFAIRNNYVYKTYETGIRVFSTGAIYQWNVSGNTIGNETDCLSTWGGIDVVANCLVYDNQVFAQGGRACIFVQSGGARIYRNRLFSTSTSIWSVSGFGGTSGCDVVDNIINTPVRVGNIPATTNLVKNNTYVGSTNKGTATLVGGTIAVAFANIDAANQVFLTKTTAGGTEGFVRVTINAGVGFTITSSSGTDTSTFAWLIV